jgi:hypothetical protein
MCYLNCIRSSTPKARMDQLKTYIDALRVLAKTNDPSRVALIERNIDNYLKTEIRGRRAFA